MLDQTDEIVDESEGGAIDMRETNQAFQSRYGFTAVTPEFFTMYPKLFNQIAGADGVISEEELAAGQDQGRLYDVTDEEIAEVTRFIQTRDEWYSEDHDENISRIEQAAHQLDEATKVVGKKGHLRQMLLFDAAWVSAADGLQDDEKEAIQHAGTAFGIDEEKIDQIMRLAELDSQLSRGEGDLDVLENNLHALDAEMRASIVAAAPSV